MKTPRNPNPVVWFFAIVGAVVLLLCGGGLCWWGSQFLAGFTGVAP